MTAQGRKNTRTNTPGEQAATVSQPILAIPPLPNTR